MRSGGYNDSLFMVPQKHNVYAQARRLVKSRKTMDEPESIANDRDW